MINFLLSAGISIVVTIASVFGVYNYLPLKALEVLNKPTDKLGVSITTIAGSDTISGSRTTINDNFSSLNAGKVENATTSMASLTTLSNLATVGTITSGTWNATAIAVNKGGTGTTSPSVYKVLLGNAADGITIASTTGTANQVFTSNGAGAYPSWQSTAVDQTIDYNFTGSNFLVKNLNASSTAANPIKLNGVSYNTPATDGASSTALMTNASGALTWNPVDWQQLGESILAGAAATTTVSSFTAKKDLRVIVDIPTVIAGACSPFLMFNATNEADSSYSTTNFFDYGSKATLSLTEMIFLEGTSAATTSPMYFDVSIQNELAYPKRAIIDGMASSTPVGAPVMLTGAGTWYNTSAQITRIDLACYAAGGVRQALPTGTRLTIYGSHN